MGPIGRWPVLLAGKRPEVLKQALAEAKSWYQKALDMAVDAQTPMLELRAALRLSRAGIPLLSQTVLLRGVNDDAAVLEALFRGLVAMRVKPYYLHHPDLARGTSHFRTGIATGQRLARSLRGRISGLCQPTYVLDIPGGYGKVPIAPCAVTPGDAPGGWIIEDGAGVRHRYPPDPDNAEG